tara:strand:- start:3173 stop:3559 length:387 start_codon:yes stop_codon:yes gene_type:complete
MMADEGPVFVKIGRWGHAGDAPLHINSVLELMKRAIARAGIEAEGFSTHSLRRGFANHAIDRNADVRELMDWVKWKDIRSALKYLDASKRLANDLAEIDSAPVVHSLELTGQGEKIPIASVKEDEPEQ